MLSQPFTDIKSHLFGEFCIGFKVNQYLPSSHVIPAFSRFQRMKVGRRSNSRRPAPLMLGTRFDAIVAGTIRTNDCPMVSYG